MSFVNANDVCLNDRHGLQQLLEYFIPSPLGFLDHSLGFL
jgi:hypothetical protein